MDFTSPIFLIFYGITLCLSFGASIYMLFGKRPFSVENDAPNMRVRRYAGCLFAFFAVSHIWTYLIYMSPAWPSEDKLMLTGILDTACSIPIVMMFLLSLLQYRRWPYKVPALATVPMIVPLVGFWVTGRDFWFLLAYAYCVTTFIFFSSYYLRQMKRYSRWLQKNYADLENKQVYWAIIVLVATAFLLLFYLVTTLNEVSALIMRLALIVYVSFIAYRVDKVVELKPLESDTENGQEDISASALIAEVFSADGDDDSEPDEEDDADQFAQNQLDDLLNEHCRDTQLYLQYDLTIDDLSRACMTNRNKLSRHFSSKGTSYHGFINALRIDHFIGLYNEAVSASGGQQSIILKELVMNSGFRNANTFRTAFKNKMGCTVKEWMESNKN